MTDKQWEDMMRFCGSRAVDNILKKHGRGFPAIGTYADTTENRTAVPIGDIGVVFAEKSRVPENLLTDLNERFTSTVEKLIDMFYEKDGKLVRVTAIGTDSVGTILEREDGECVHINTTIWNKFVKGGVKAWQGEGLEDPVYFTHQYGELLGILAPIRTGRPDDEEKEAEREFTA